MKRNALVLALVIVFVTICFSDGFGANGTLADGVVINYGKENLSSRVS